MRTALFLAALSLLAAGCRKKLEAEPAKESSAAPAPAPAPADASGRVQPAVDANMMHGAELIKKAQVAADMADREVHKEEKTDVPAQ